MIFWVCFIDGSWLKILKAMNIFEFINHFPNKESCESSLKKYRIIPASIVRRVNVSQNTIGSVEGRFLSAANAGEDLLLKPVH
jgi:hypothetical protein